MINIAHIEWGQIEVEHDHLRLTFKDCGITPDGAKNWDWNVTGTRHVPGTQPSDIRELLEHDLEVMILSRGMQLVLQTNPETLQTLERAGIEHHVLETREAVRLFNTLIAQGRRVGGLFHSTC